MDSSLRHHGGLASAFYWYQIFVLDPVVVKTTARMDESFPILAPLTCIYAFSIRVDTVNNVFKK